LFGGESGGRGVYRIRRANGKIELVPANSNNEIKRGDMLIYNSAGGGGYGDPWKRSAGRVLQDVIEGLVSFESAKSHYGVMIDETYEIVGALGQRKSHGNI
jgi:N-methylhydantoinase B